MVFLKVPRAITIITIRFMKLLVAQQIMPVIFIKPTVFFEAHISVVAQRFKSKFFWIYLILVKPPENLEEDQNRPRDLTLAVLR